MATFKTIDVFAAVDRAILTDSQGTPILSNLFNGSIVRGDPTLLRFTLFAAADSTTPFVIPSDAGLEFVISNAFSITSGLSTNLLAYADDGDFDPVDWVDFSRSGGKVSCSLDTNKTNLKTALGTSENGDFFGSLTLMPAGTCDRFTLVQFDITVLNDIYRDGEDATTAIVINTPCLNSSSSSTEVLDQSSSSQSNSTSSSESSSSSSQSSSSQSSLSSSSLSSSSNSSSSQSSSSSSQSSSSRENSFPLFARRFGRSA